MERSSGYFVRYIRLVEAVDKNAVTSEYKDGVLRIMLPKSKGASLTKLVRVESAEGPPIMEIRPQSTPAIQMFP